MDKYDGALYYNGGLAAPFLGIVDDMPFTFRLVYDEKTRQLVQDYLKDITKRTEFRVQTLHEGKFVEISAVLPDAVYEGVDITTVIEQAISDYDHNKNLLKRLSTMTEVKYGE